MLAHLYALMAIIGKILEAVFLFIASLCEMCADRCQDLVDHCKRKIDTLEK